eukprot:comp23846_c0_seq1/m.41656 comp23846_c0_seq1/g.41656  ORF comp23846_c0_seq1/g.41656 comp23846_c0_seq1/m.41656 type:complete len:1033 (-) comp23846_c0_seq1:12-3110(-)
MPLYKRTEWQPKPHPKGIEQDDLVFHIPYTGEVFLEYEDYIERVETYAEPEWSCCLTGKKNLTLQQAMDSEKAAGQKLNQFPDTHLEAVVRMMHHAPGNAEALVDTIYDAFRESYVVGEEVMHEVDGNSVLAVVKAVHEVNKEVTVEVMVNGHTTNKKGKKSTKKEEGGEEEKTTAKKGKGKKKAEEEEEGGETEAKKGKGKKEKKGEEEEGTKSQKGKRKSKKKDGEAGEEQPKKKPRTKKNAVEGEEEEAGEEAPKKGKGKKSKSETQEEEGEEAAEEQRKSAKKTPKKANSVEVSEGKQTTGKGKKKESEEGETKTKSAKGTKKKAAKSDSDDSLPLKLTAKGTEGRGVKREAPENGEQDVNEKSTTTKKAKTSNKKKKTEEGEEKEEKAVGSSRGNTPTKKTKTKKTNVDGEGEDDAVSVKSQKSTKSAKEEVKEEPKLQTVTKIEVTYFYDIEYTEEGWEGKTASNVPQEELSRTGSRHPLPKPMLRAFVRDSAKREPFIGSVWVVKDEYVQRFNLPTELPPEAAALKEKWDQKEEARAKRKKEDAEDEEDKQEKKQKKQDEKEKKKVEKIQYPIEDNDLPTDPSLLPRPIESTDFLIGKEHAGSLFKTWHFMHQFSNIIKLSRFPIEDYERALLHAEDEQSRDAGPDPNPLLLAVYCALLNALAEDMAAVHQPDSGSDGETDTEAKSVATTEAEVMPWADRDTWEDTLTWYLEKQARGPRKVLIPPELLKRGLSFTSLVAVEKLRLVEYLVDEVAEADGIREVVESNIEEARLLLHERRMERAAYKKIVREEQADRRRQKQLQHQNGEGGDESDNSEESEQAEQQEDQEDQPDLNKLLEEGRGSRRAILEYQRMVREKEQQKKQHELEEKRREQAAKSAEARAAAAERKKAEEREREEQRKEAKFQETMSRLLGVRAEPLGQDRANNTYWYLDPARLLVEHVDGTFGYYSSQLELDQLLGHLNIKGVREMQLSDRLQLLYKTMHTAMKKRQEELKREEDGRRSARLQARNKDNAFMYYENKLAEEH